jgi:hypothetical protein
VIADRDLFGPLVRAHLRMSFRGRASQAFAGQLAGRPVGVAWLFVMYLAIGAATLPVIAGGADVFTYALVTQLMTWTMCGLSLTAEAGDALFAPSEPDVLGHRPVLADVVLAAKVTVLFAFSCSLALAQNLLPTIAIAVRASWWTAIVHVAIVALVVALITILVTIVYGVAARLVPRDRFDDVAAWSQTGLALVFVALALVTPQSALRRGSVHVSPEDWMWMGMAPAWFAGLEAWIATGSRDFARLAIAAGVAVGGVLLIVRGSVLSRLAEAMAHIVDERGGRDVRALPTGEGWPLRGWLRDPVERAAFQLATAYLRRDRDVRLRLRPSLVVFALLPLAGLVIDTDRGGHLVPLASVCLLGMVPGVALEALRISSHPVASELFATVPIAGTSAIFHGVRKAALWYVVPGLALAVALAAISQPSGLVLAVPGILALPVLSLIPGLFGPYVPLARPKGRGQQAVANAVLLATSTGLLAVLVQATLLASRRGAITSLYIGEVIVILGVDRGLRFVIGRRGLTTLGASPT